MDRLQFGDMDEIGTSVSDHDSAIVQAIQERRIYAHIQILPPTPLFCIGTSEVMSLGDFSLIKGKAKSRKTFLMSMFGATMLRGGEMFGITPHFYDHKKRVVWFDTEQNPYHTQKAIIRATELSFNTNHDFIEMYTLRDLSPAQRKEFITKVIVDLNTSEDISLVIIDGVKDLVTSINDEDQATQLATWLLTITTQKNLHIINVIHENKSVMDKTARGHLGAELTNKAQCIITLERDKNDKELSIVKCEQIRGAKEFDSIGFKINDFGLPVSAPVPDEDDNVRKPKNTVTSFDIELHKIILDKIFKVRGFEIGYTDLWKAIQLQFELMDPQKRPSDNVAKQMVTYWQNEKMIFHNGESGRIKAKYLKTVENTHGLEV